MSVNYVNPVAELLFRNLDDIIKSYRTEKLLKTALSCEAIRNLYQQATEIPGINGKSQKITIKFVGKNEIPFDGESDPVNRQIKLLSNISDDRALSIFVFELTNIVHASKHYEINKRVEAGEMDCEEFVYRTEKIEFEGAQMHHRIMERAVKEMGWSEELDFYRELPQDFDFWWLNYQKNSSHANAYRKMWSIMRPQHVQELAINMIFGSIFANIALPFLISDIKKGPQK